MRDFLGYLVLGVLLVGLFWLYDSKTELITPNFLILFALAAAAAVISVTISVFWLWNEERVERLERTLGMLGHIPHCGYCLSLWIAAIYTGVLGISLFGGLNLGTLSSFLLTWWALGFLNAVFFEILTILGFKKVKMEFELRALYQRSQKT